MVFFPDRTSDSIVCCVRKHFSVLNALFCTDVDADQEHIMAVVVALVRLNWYYVELNKNSQLAVEEPSLGTAITNTRRGAFNGETNGKIVQFLFQQIV